MDIAAIRKKAKATKSDQSQQLAEFAIQTRPPAIATATSTVEALLSEPTPTLTNPAETDPLDKIFNYTSLSLSVDETTLSTAPEMTRDEIDDSRRWLAFMLGDEQYALEISQIKEIIKPREITDIPRVPDFLLGIISLRGNIISIFDLRNRLRLGKSQVTPDSRIIVCQTADRSAGLLVDRITQVIALRQHQIEPPPAILHGIDRELISGVGREQGNMMILLHLPNVLNAELV